MRTTKEGRTISQITADLAASELAFETARFRVHRIKAELRKAFAALARDVKGGK